MRSFGRLKPHGTAATHFVLFYEYLVYMNHAVFVRLGLAYFDQVN